MSAGDNCENETNKSKEQQQQKTTKEAHSLNMNFYLFSHTNTQCVFTYARIKRLKSINASLRPPLLCPSFCNSAIMRVRLQQWWSHIHSCTKSSFKGPTCAQVGVCHCVFSSPVSQSQLRLHARRGSIGMHKQAAKSISACIESRVPDA